MKRFAIFIFLLSSWFAKAQNLLLDGGFEKCNPSFDCDWQPIAGTPDFFGENCDSLENPYMVNTGHRARSGQNYLGYLLGYRSEFILGRLSAPLQAGEEYYVEMYVQKSTRPEHQTLREISVQFTRSVPDVSPKHRTINGKFTSLKGPAKWLRQENGWERVTGTYLAEGGEQYLVLGNFAGANLDLTKMPASDNIFYYYFDDIVVEPAVKYFTDTAVGTTIALENILFETGKHELLPASFTTLNQLAANLQAHPAIEIEIRGHTDDVGQKTANQLLSTNRAQAVADYLVAQGISTQRLSSKGYGDSLPVASNKTEDGRRLNRRVEMRIVKSGD